jgi:nicotinamidase/pyrazinamidase
MKALVIVDMENDFMPQGALGVSGADKLIPIINALIPKFPLVVACQDWHPVDHVSFAASHPGKKPGDHIKVKDFDQVLWPVHCVQYTRGAEMVRGLHDKEISRVFHKGSDKNIDSYSAFFDNARQRSTGLGEYLKGQGVTEVYLAGVATDYCILYSALDALDLGFSVHVVIDACRAINLKPQDEEHALAKITARGGHIITSEDLQ